MPRLAVISQPLAFAQQQLLSIRRTGFLLVRLSEFRHNDGEWGRASGDRREGEHVPAAP
jgi:hypothetical protein